MESLVSERRKMLKRWKYLKKYHNEVIAEFENYVDEKDYEELMDICSNIDDFYIDIKEFIKTKNADTNIFDELIRDYSYEVTNMDFEIKKMEDVQLHKLFHTICYHDYIEKFDC